jgi:hypothetical protein
MTDPTGATPPQRLSDEPLADEIRQLERAWLDGHAADVSRERAARDSTNDEGFDLLIGVAALNERLAAADDANRRASDDRLKRLELLLREQARRGAVASPGPDVHTGGNGLYTTRIVSIGGQAPPTANDTNSASVTGCPA